MYDFLNQLDSPGEKDSFVDGVEDFTTDQFL